MTLQPKSSLLSSLPESLVSMPPEGAPVNPCCTCGERGEMTGVASALKGPEPGERCTEASRGAGWLGISSRRVSVMKAVRTELEAVGWKLSSARCEVCQMVGRRGAGGTDWVELPPST